MNEPFDIWQLLAGLGIFLFGMYLLEDSIKSLSGKTFRKMISHYTNGRFRAICSGSLVTAILQSSSAVSLMVLAFVGAEIMSMENAIAVMMGANIGTTFTAWIVAVLGFKLNIDTVAFPFLGLAGITLIFAETNSRLFNISRLLIGFGLLLLGLNFMKISVADFSATFDLRQFQNYGLWFYLLVGAALTALMQSSSATIAITLTALSSQIISFNIGVAMVIGANIGTTVTVMLGALGQGVRAKKLVGISHLIFNLVTGLIVFLGANQLAQLIGRIVDINANGVIGLAIFHTVFNIFGVIIFFPFIGRLAKILDAIYPQHQLMLTVYLDKTPVEVTDAATTALAKELRHLLQECQLYNLRVLAVRERTVFTGPLPFERQGGRRFGLDELYANIKLLHGEIFTYYAKLQAQIIEEAEVHKLARMIFASRNIMNSIKNLKGIRTDLAEFEGADNDFLNNQYKIFQNRLLGLYQTMNPLLDLDNREEQYQQLLKLFLHIEDEDKTFIRQTMEAVAGSKLKKIEISSLLLANRLFTQACRLQVFGLKDLLLADEQIKDFDKALDMKAMIEEEKNRETKTADPKKNHA